MEQRGSWLRRARAFAAVLRFLPRRVARVEYALAETQTALREIDRRAEQAARIGEDNTRQLQVRAVMEYREAVERATATPTERRLAAARVHRHAERGVQAALRPRRRRERPSI